MSWNERLQCTLLLALVAVPLSIPSLQATSFGGWPALGFSAVLCGVGASAAVAVALTPDDALVAVDLVEAKTPAETPRAWACSSRTCSRSPRPSRVSSS